MTLQTWKPPLVKKMSFKRVLLGCFALQRLIVWIAMSISFYCSPAEALLMSIYQEYSLGLLIGSIIISIMLLGLLYYLRRKGVLKWLALMLFSISEVATWIGFDDLVHTKIRSFNCSFTLAWALLIWLFDEIRGVKQSRIVDTTPKSMKRANSADAWIDPINDPGTIPRVYGAGNYEFLKIHIDGPFAFVLVSVTSAVLFTFYRFLPAMDYGMSLIFQLVLITWFALDLRRLDRILGSDEASQGVIYMYIDAVLAVGYVAMVAAAIGAMVFFIAGFVMSGPAAKGISGGCAGCGCGGCTNCCEWNCEDYQTLFSDSKCLFFNEKGSSFECCESSMDEMPTIADLRKRGSDLDQGMERV